MGKAWNFGDNLNTDEIIPGRYNITIDARELAAHVFCEIKPEFTQAAQPGDVVVGGQNFGCGSSREHAPIAIKGAGNQRNQRRDAHTAAAAKMASTVYAGT